MVSIGCGFKDAILKPGFHLVRQFADEFADVGVELAAKVRILHRFSENRLKLGQGIHSVQSRCGGGLEGADHETFNPCCFIAMMTNATSSSMAESMRLENAARVAVRIRSAAASSWPARPLRGLSRWISPV
jgi:hypothetical protein